MKKKLKDTKGFKILKDVVNGAINNMPGPIEPFISIFKKKYDRDGDGKITYKDFKWFEFLGGIAVISALAKLGIIDIEVVINLAQTLLGIGS